MRRSEAKIRIVLPDAVYGDVLVSRMIGVVMSRGKKATAEKVVWSAFEVVQRKMKLRDMEVVEVFHRALANARPSMEVKSRRVGGATYPVPVSVPERKSIFRALSWIAAAARAKSGAPMYERLADELLDAYNGRGAAVKKKDDMHKMADANKAFAQYSF